AVVGPARVQAFARGFFIEQGVLRAMVKPGVVPFTGRTPHGEIIVLGTIFVCRVGEHQTEVQVEQGKVRIVSMRGPERVLVAGQKASMLYSAHAGTPGEIRENPAVESDPSQ
ncbi:MAG TPA: FecR domain-containing protein, partial [Candidatus Ozemobacteraceae bacterium]|nr:FecR domain-containing protein [Candidatus Ozemobacteraceae bacterium]